jgi:UDP-glucose 4-epimerase
VPGEVYNIGSGAGRRVDEVLRTLAAFSQVYFTIREDPTRLRPPDVPSLVCNSAKFRAQTGWEPLIPFERTMNDLLNHWRSEISGVQIENLALGVGENPLSEVITAQPSPTDVGMVRQGVA